VLSNIQSSIHGVAGHVTRKRRQIKRRDKGCDYVVPERNDFICTDPMISECSTVPFDDTSKFNFSTTSKKISFFRCFIPRTSKG
jgi:hypothetical protein